MVMSDARASEGVDRLGLRQPSAALRSVATAPKAPEDWRTPKAGGHAAAPMQSRAASHVLRMKLVGANASAPPRGEEPWPGKVNYIVGNDSSRWRTNIPTFAKVRYHDVFPGIDLVYYGIEGQLEYDLIVAPGADPSSIALAIEGAERLETNERGDLLVCFGGQQVRWRRPKVYQPINGSNVAVAGAYVLSPLALDHGTRGTQLVSFNLAAYDSTRPLVIDPALSYGTFLPSIHGFVAADPDGNAYVTGGTSSAQFPTQNPLQGALSGETDGFVTKLDRTGQMVYSTYVGGSGRDGGMGIAVDSTGSAYVVGSTWGSFPLVNAVQPSFGGGRSDGFVLKLSPGGSALVYSTYLGGSGDSDASLGVAVDTAGNAYVCGSTSSGDFPTKNAAQPHYGAGSDAYITKLNPSGTALLYSTYLGGTNSEMASSIAVDAEGNAYVGGSTQSADFPTKAPFQSQPASTGDGFFAALDPAGKLMFSSYLGGSGSDYIAAITVGSNGDVYLAGQTTSFDFPTTNAIQPWLNGTANGFVARYNPASNNLVFSTFLGGGGGGGLSWGDYAQALAVDSTGNVYVGGATPSPNFPTTPDALQPSYAGGTYLGDAFLSVFSSDGLELIYSSYLGGSGDDQVWGLAIYPAGDVYLGGEIYAPDADFPIPNPILPNPVVNWVSSYAVFVVKFTPIVSPAVLTAILAGRNLVISWPTNATGFSLEQSDTLAPAANWSVATNAPVVVGDQNVVTVPVDSGMKFFRLIKP
jgi:hypothetical protein